MSAWEKVSEKGAQITYRLRVTGGWIYRHEVCYSNHDPAVAMVFVPCSLDEQSEDGE